MAEDEIAVFRALADPTRRRLLDLLLAHGGQTLTELSAPFEPEMTRFGVMKHVRQLEAAGLIVTRPDGRTTRHYLNPVPIRMLSRRWLDRYAEHASDALIDLRNDLEGTITDGTTDPSTQVYQVFIRATPERIWQALVDPEVTAKYFHGARMAATAERMVSYGPNGDVWGDSPVEVWDPPHRLAYGWQSLYDPELAAEPASRVTFEISDEGGGVCKLVVVHDRLGASPKTAGSVGGAGWMFVLSNMKSYLETGEPLTPAA